MGDNFKAAGFASVEAFVLAMTRSEAEHLMAFTRFVKNNKRMLAALRKHDWAAFAAAYNGPGYRKNSYDTKLEAAHRRFSSEAEKAKPSLPSPAAGRLAMNRLPQAAPRRALLAALVGLALAGPAAAGGQAARKGCAPRPNRLVLMPQRQRRLDRPLRGGGAWPAIPLRPPRPDRAGLPAAGRPDFRYAHYFRAGVDRTEVSFRNGDADYAVFDYTEGRQRSAGVRVLTASGREKTFACRGAVHSRLGALEAVLPCDPDSALNLGSCPAGR
jgi:hypothetical protein